MVDEPKALEQFEELEGVKEPKNSELIKKEKAQVSPGDETLKKKATSIFSFFKPRRNVKQKIVKKRGKSRFDRRKVKLERRVTRVKKTQFLGTRFAGLVPVVNPERLRSTVPFRAQRNNINNPFGKNFSKSLDPFKKVLRKK